MNKPWNGRFTEDTNSEVEVFTASVGFDHRLFASDIDGSIAHARMLAGAGILGEEDCNAIVEGLEDIGREIARGEFAWSVELEDVHMNIEARLIDRIGDAGKKLHTGRSRNDQVATDLRLYLRDEIDRLTGLAAALVGAITDMAETEAGTVMPGFTHMQPAQPVTFGHHLLAWAEMLLRDLDRLQDCRRRVNVMPLGAAALAGTSFPIQREHTAAQLGFEGLAENSLDAVSDRDFAIEFCACAAILMMHLSRISEELIIWSSPRFGFVELGDAFCTGSSIMPQKKNPDVPELVRGKTGRVYGHLVGLLTLMKAQPLAYNKDNQEDKEPLFDTVDTLRACLSIYTALLGALTVDRERMRDAALQGHTTATDLADYLVRKGVAFRDAHHIVGNAVKLAIERQCDVSELDFETLAGLHEGIGADVADAISLDGSVAARAHVGGTAPARVHQAAAGVRERLGRFSGE